MTAHENEKTAEREERKERKAWTKPAVISISAGSAENRPGQRSFDGSIEGIGS